MEGIWLAFKEWGMMRAACLQGEKTFSDISQRCLWLFSCGCHAGSWCELWSFTAGLAKLPAVPVLNSSCLFLKAAELKGLCPECQPFGGRGVLQWLIFSCSLFIDMRSAYAEMWGWLPEQRAVHATAAISLGRQEHISCSGTEQFLLSLLF